MPMAGDSEGPGSASPESASPDSVSRLAGLFLSDAAEVDATGRLPVEHLRALADAGLYGVFAPVPAGGLGLTFPQMCSVVEELASACLASTFVWIQHFGLLGALLDEGTPEGLRTGFLPGVIRGEVRGGVVLAGLLPGPPRLTAQPVPGGWRLDGQAPWVSGWGYVHLLMVVARGPADSVVTLLVDARDQPGLTAERQRLTAADASATVRLGFDGLFVPADRYVGQQPFDPVRQQSEGLRLNGSLALGVGRRCCALIGPSALDEELRRSRAELDEATTETMPAARARASRFAARAASALAVHHGSASALAGDDAERLTREALFLLVFGSRPAIKETLFRQLSTGEITSQPG
ncbi:MAG TPA: acyl-CoA dehydrogenase family protein [Streptosporangiaceae bacterium]|nr:acyl-CoA dehydrogenase family protein [Streptosporangiaceae bacterium]